MPDGVRQLSSRTKKFAAFVADEIDPGDVDVDVARYVDVDHLAIVVFRRIHEFARHALFAQDALRVIDVVDERVERAHALRDAALDARPLLGREDARDDVERKHALGAGGIGVDRERHAAL